ncbi:MAG TPA: TIGR03067 domain-containing protein [Gemmataceae bacterium]|jgi:uncharacterized protein (TIGR03067 family)|nr:TIGR03067 domain-containing protein [Gemmataceae bacterium]
MKVVSPLAVTLALAGLALVALAAPKPADKDADEPLKKLAGDWAITAWTAGGEDLPAEALADTRWSVKGDKYVFKTDGEKEEGTIKLDPAAKPATIDLAITAGEDKGKTQVGIYKIDGDTVVFCFNKPGEKDRPKDFKATADNDFILITVKKKPKDD